MTRNVRVCVDCGARYATPGLPARHTAATGHAHFRTVRETVQDTPARITYQQGYGPAEREEN